MVNHSAMKCLLAADSDSVVSGNDDHSGGNGVGLLQRSLGAGAGNGSVCKKKKRRKCTFLCSSLSCSHSVFHYLLC